jgi:hypothetical protein
MGKKAKEHRKKVEKRNRMIEQERRRFEKVTQNLIERMKQETQSQSSSMFPSSFNLSNLEGPLMVPPTQDITSNSTILNGPQI